MLMAEHGFRVNAALYLRWEDIDLVAGTVTLEKAWEKTKRTSTRPLTPGGLSAILTAAHHRARLGKSGPWVFYGKGEAPYTYQGYWLALRKAERAADIGHKPFRAAHGLRRGVVGNVRAETGDPALALLWVGDHDLRQATRYFQEREDEIEAVANRTSTVPDAARGGRKP